MAKVVNLEKQIYQGGGGSDDEEDEEEDDENQNDDDEEQDDDHHQRDDEEEQEEDDQSDDEEEQDDNEESEMTSEGESEDDDDSCDTCGNHDMKKSTLRRCPDCHWVDVHDNDRYIWTCNGCGNQHPIQNLTKTHTIRHCDACGETQITEHDGEEQSDHESKDHEQS